MLYYIGCFKWYFKFVYLDIKKYLLHKEKLIYNILQKQNKVDAKSFLFSYALGGKV